MQRKHRREFLAIAGAGVVAGAVGAYAAEQKYDLVIKGGRVVDPSQKLNAVRDVAMANGRVAAIGANIAAGGAEVFDASNRIVTPGLIDIHTHVANVPTGPSLVLADGVTCWIDAGQAGADNIDKAIAGARAAPQKGALLINIGRKGMGGGFGDTEQLEWADVDLCKAAIAAHRDIVVGIKARLSPEYCGNNDDEVLRRAVEAATPFNIPVMIHIGNTYSPLGKLLNRLRPGDIVTHLWVPPPHNMFDDAGKLIPEAVAARKRGVKFDVGFGRLGHVRWDIAEQAMKAGFLPDTTSTDWTTRGHDEGVLFLPNMMSHLLSLGMTLDQTIACVTNHAAADFPIFKGHGTLKPGAPADAAILELQEGDFVFADTFKNERHAKQKLVNRATVLGGKVAWRQAV